MSYLRRDRVLTSIDQYLIILLFSLLMINHECTDIIMPPPPYEEASQDGRMIASHKRRRKKPRMDLRLLPVPALSFLAALLLGSCIQASIYPKRVVRPVAHRHYKAFVDISFAPSWSPPLTTHRLQPSGNIPPLVIVVSRP